MLTCGEKTYLNLAKSEFKEKNPEYDGRAFASIMHNHKKNTGSALDFIDYYDIFISKQEILIS